MKPKINKVIIRRLEDSLRAIKGATAHDQSRCAVADEHRAAMRLYLQTWAEAPLEAALKAIKGEVETYDIDW